MQTEIECFASKFVDGKNSFNEKRHIPVGIGRYINQRLFNVDNTFAEDPTYIFWAQYVKEVNELSNCMSVAMRKTTSSFNNKPITSDMLVDQEQINKLFRADDGFKFMKTVRGTPAYWEQTMRDLFSMIRQLGIPTFFTSFSAADRRWTEIVKCICSQLGRQYDEDMNWTDYCHLINKNVVTATRMFDHRVKCFLRDFLMSPANPIGKITDYFHRVEFQARGWPHLHCLIWIENAPVLDVQSDEAICEFIDQFITSHTPKEEDDQEMYELVSHLQTHSKKHSKSCRKGNRACRFNFPRPPSTRTFIARPLDVTPEEKKIAKEKLTRLWDFANDPVNSSLNAEQILNLASLTQDDFEKSICSVATKNTVYLKRTCSDLWTNNYNPSLLSAWSANIDIQYILDAYR